MIQITEKTNCCGCGACVQRCPNACITMHEDEQGFLYPKVDTGKCIECGLCEKVCPVMNHGEPRQPLTCYAAINKDEKIRLASSSGGVFTALAEYVIANSGVVFGARFNEKWEVVHDYTETIEGLAAFRGSKYVQSTIGDNYRLAEQFLKDGRQVLFTGTPCQIAGLKHYLRKEYENLLSVEVACHGVPSPLVWREYIKDKNPQCINFRDKKDGWKRFGLTFDNVGESHSQDLYMRAFLSNLTLRPSCFNCKLKSGVSNCDLLVADYWGINNIHPELDDDKGVSLVVVFSFKILDLFKELDLLLEITDYKKAALSNIAIESCFLKPRLYDTFWCDFEKNGLDAIEPILNKMTPSIFSSLFNAIKVKTKLLFINCIRK